ncbi:hypothetical protein JCM6882_000868 [Rhodosporidiobolus microsporus]
MTKPHASPPSTPPLVNLNLATPKPHPASLFPAPPLSPPASNSSSSGSSSSSAPPAVAPAPKAKQSKNSLFDASFAPILPPPPSSASVSGRSRSSTAESRYSTDSASSMSTGEGRSSRKSWMDIDFERDSPPFSQTASIPPSTSSSTLTPGIPALAPPSSIAGKPSLHKPSLDSRGEYAWPLTPPSPFPTSSTPSTAVPTVPSVMSLPPPVSPPRPAAPSRSSTFKPPSPPTSTSTSSSTAAPSPPSVAAGKSSNPLLDTRQSPLLRLSPTAPYLLGEGRHASVYLAAFLPRAEGEGKEMGRGTVRAEKRDGRKREWKLCAAKRLLPDRDSQVGGLGEAFILAKLAPPSSAAGAGEEEDAAYPARGARNIIGLFGVRDERDGVEKPLPLPAVTPLSASAAGGGGGGGLSRNGSRKSWDGPKSPLKQSYGDEEGEGENGDALAIPPRSRKTSASSTLSRRPRHSEPLAAGGGGPAAGAASGNGHHRLSLLSALEPPLASSRRRVSSGGPASAGPSSPSLLPLHQPSASRPSSVSSTSPSSPSSAPPSPEPRISLLLSYSPSGHVLHFARAHPERMGKSLWLRWARDLAGAVEWCHSRGVLHADLKPQNVMLSPALTPLLSDFGSSLFLPPPPSPSHLFPTDPHGLGTPTYSPPEFVRPLPSPFSYPADIFSLGVTLGVLLTAREPYEGLRTMERMVWVSKGGWWEWEERRRLAELAEEGEEMDLEEVAPGEEGDLSRTGSMRSVRSGRSSLRSSLRRRERGRREESVESVRSWASTPEGGFAQTPVRTYAWEEVARSLLLDAEDADGEGDGVAKAVREAMPSRLVSANASRPVSPSHSRQASASSTASASPIAALTPSSSSALPPPTLFYPTTSTPVQYFLSFLAAADDAQLAPPTAEDVVPLAVRELLRRMTLSGEEERLTAREVREELERVGREEDVEM